ncbi:MAG TPA: SDR family oxidoreductase [Gammaproteobacteria bacterium]|nr:SDR family oxidoreductase [Gammaproteobacteria bacterium]
MSNEAPVESVADGAPSGSVLLLGAAGLIGGAALARFRAAGRTVRAVARQAGVAQDGVEWRPLDIAQCTTAAAWLPHLAGVDTVVNCAGALQGEALRAVHVDSARALYEACAQARVRRVVHLSAIGVDRESVSAFSKTKRAGEEALLESTLDWVILRPSVVVGRGAFGGSALFRGLAALPVTLELPNAGPIQVVQLDELAETIVALSRPTAPARIALDVAGPERLELVDVITAFRRWLRFGAAPRWRVPSWLAACGYRLGDLARALGWRPPIGNVARRELTRGAVGDSRAWQELMRIEPKSLATALAREPASVQERWFARLYFQKALAFAILALFWIGTGVISLSYGWAQGLAYLLEGGVPQELAVPGVVAGALADIAIGVGIAFRRTARGALWAAVAISVFYMLAGSFVLPRLWLDPVGPMLKIWPIIVLHLVALAILEDR